jgi:UPF0716 protein FxsA
MFGYLVVLFTLVPALELYLLIHVGSSIGAGNTILIIIMTGIWGAYLARLQGFLVIQKIQTNLNKGAMPSSELIDGVMILVGGILLLTPGFMTDAFGFLLLVPFTRALIKLMLKGTFEKMIKKGNDANISRTQPNQNQYDDIDIN